MPAYTVIGWQMVSRSVDIAYFDARDALGAARASFEARWPQQPDWRFVAAFAGKLRPAAIWPVTAERSSPARRLAAYTIVGFWRFSGETFCRSLGAGSGREAILLAQHRTATPEELQLVAALDGRLVATVTAENLPVM